MMKNTLSDPLYGKGVVTLLLWSTNTYLFSDFYSRRGPKVNVNLCNKSKSVMGNQEIKPWKEKSFLERAKSLIVQYHMDRSATTSTTNL